MNGTDDAGRADACACDDSTQRCVRGACVTQTVVDIHISVDGAARFSICFSHGDDGKPALQKIDDQWSAFYYEPLALDPAGSVKADIGTLTIEGEHGQKYDFGPPAHGDLTTCYVPLNGAMWAEMDPGERVHVAATGGKDVPAFALDLHMPHGLTVDSPARTFVAGQPLDVLWHPAVEERMTVTLVANDETWRNPIKVVYAEVPNTGEYLIPSYVTGEMTVPKPLVFLEADTSRRLTPGDRGIVVARFTSRWPVPLR